MNCHAPGSKHALPAAPIHSSLRTEPLHIMLKEVHQFHTLKTYFNTLFSSVIISQLDASQEVIRPTFYIHFLFPNFMHLS